MSTASSLQRGCAALCFTLAFGCGEDAAEPSADTPTSVEAEVSEDIATVVHVRWNTSAETAGFVEFGPTSELGSATPLETEEGTEHRAALLGLKPDTEYHFRVVSESGESSDVQSIVTGSLPTTLPALTHTGGGHDLYTVVPILGATQAVTILDADGDIVWYHNDDRELDFYRARLSIDGKTLVYNAASVSGDPADNSELVRVALDGSESSSISVPLLAHDFVEHPDGTLGAIVVEYRDFEGTEIRGDQIVEIAPDGTQTTVFSVWDCFDPAELSHDDIEHGWTFANALDFDPEENAYYLGMRNFSSIAKIDRESGECVWVIGLYGSTFDFASGSGRFLHQHQFEVNGDHLLVFDNEGATGRESRVLEFELDFDANVATEVWNYVADPIVSTFVLGEPSRLENGDTFVNWSAAGQIERVTNEGESLWQVNSEAGYAFGFSTLVKSLYEGPAR